MDASPEGAGPFPPWRGELRDRPTVYATLGIVYNATPELFAAIINALSTKPVNLVVTLGANQDPKQFAPQPSHVHIERWLPQQLLLPHCDVVVTHGGYGTVTAAVTWGIPLVLLPISAISRPTPRAARRSGSYSIPSAVPPPLSAPPRERCSTTRGIAAPPREWPDRPGSDQGWTMPSISSRPSLTERGDAQDRQAGVSDQRSGRGGDRAGRREGVARQWHESRTFSADP